MFFKKATKFGEIFTVDSTVFSKCQIDGEDFVNFCGLLRKHELFLRLKCKICFSEKATKTLCAIYLKFIPEGNEFLKYKAPFLLLF